MAFADRPDVAGAVVVSDDGLVVETALGADLDPEELAALAASAVRSLSALAEASQRGPVAQVVLDGDRGTVILQRLPAGVLVVLAAADGDLGRLLYDLRRHTPALLSYL
jgi:hypothetical protein